MSMCKVCVVCIVHGVSGLRWHSMNLWCMCGVDVGAQCMCVVCMV